MFSSGSFARMTLQVTMGSKLRASAYLLPEGGSCCDARTVKYARRVAYRYDI